MIQYCRYCINAEDYNGEGEDFLCFADAPCGNNGAGRFYPANKAKRTNKCRYFVGFALDIFSEREYAPRPISESDYEQLSYEQLRLIDLEVIGNIHDNPELLD